MTREKAKTIGYWAVTILGPFSFVYGGILHLQQAPEVMANLQHLGYPDYFAYILGTGKLLGALAIVAPGFRRLKEWAYAGFFFDLASGAFSRAAVGDSTVEIIAPLVFLALTMASWALRPESRRLPAPAASARAESAQGYVHDRGFSAGTAETSIS